MSKPITLALTGKLAVQDLSNFATQVKNSGPFRGPLRVSQGKDGVQVLHQRTWGQFFKEKLSSSCAEVRAAREAAHGAVKSVINQMEGHSLSGSTLLNNINKQIGDGKRDIRVSGDLVKPLNALATSQNLWFNLNNPLA